MANPMPEAVRVGIAVWIIHGNKVLMNYRIKPHGGGTWAPPGGHLEMNESWEECARREALEEAGIEINDVEYFGLTNDIFPETGKHYITIHMQAHSQTDKIINNEPEKYQKYEWFAANEFPSPLFLCTANLLTQNLKPPYLAT